MRPLLRLPVIVFVVALGLLAFVGSQKYLRQISNTSRADRETETADTVRQAPDAQRNLVFGTFEKQLEFILFVNNNRDKLPALLS